MSIERNHRTSRFTWWWLWGGVTSKQNNNLNIAPTLTTRKELESQTMNSSSRTRWRTEVMSKQLPWKLNAGPGQLQGETEPEHSPPRTKFGEKTKPFAGTGQCRVWASVKGGSPGSCRHWKVQTLLGSPPGTTQKDWEEPWESSPVGLASKGQQQPLLKLLRPIAPLRGKSLTFQRKSTKPTARGHGRRKPAAFDEKVLNFMFPSSARKLKNQTAGERQSRIAWRQRGETRCSWEGNRKIKALSTPGEGRNAC